LFPCTRVIKQRAKATEYGIVPTRVSANASL
jgi:hypothetical protein